MTASTIIMHKSAGKLDNSVKGKVFTFLEKLAKDDATPGLNIERINHSKDGKFRTGRVDKFWRAVLFHLSGTGSNNYVFYGVFQHDKAIELASKLTLSVNAVNGVAEITRIEENTEESPDALVPPSVEHAIAAAPVPAAAPIGEKTPAQHFASLDRDYLISTLGLKASFVAAAEAAASAEVLLEALIDAPEWQADALLDLAVGTPVAAVEEKLGFRTDSLAEAELIDAVDTAESDEISVGVDPLSEDAQAADAILRGLAKDAARLSFATIDGEDELKQVIDDGDFQAWRVFLHPEQRRWTVRSYKGPFRLSGGAGTGKTVVLLHRAVRLAQARPQARIVLSTFTTTMSDELSAQLETLAPDYPRAQALGDPGIYVAGPDKLALEVIRSASPEALSRATTAVLGGSRSVAGKATEDRIWEEILDSSSANLPERVRSAAFLTTEYDQVVLPHTITDEARYVRVARPGRKVRLSRDQRKSVWTLVESYRSRTAVEQSTSFTERRYIAAMLLNQAAEAFEVPGADPEERRLARPVDHLLVDEGQDLTGGHWRMLRALVTPGRDDMFLAEDSHQRIYGERITLSRFGVAIVGRSRRLTLNYRTTENNLRFGVAILSGGKFSDMEDGGETVAGYRSLRIGTAPVVIESATPTAEMDVITDVISGWITESEGDPAYGVEQLAILVRDANGRRRIVSGLAERGITVTPVEGKSAPVGNPIVMTMHRAKGTEFRNVLLAGVSAKNIPASLRAERYSEEVDDDVDLRERSLLYVAATRARDQLVVTYSDEPSPFLPVLVNSGEDS